MATKTIEPQTGIRSHPLFVFIGRVTVLQVVTYFVFGSLFAFVVKIHVFATEPYATETANFMRPENDILVMAGPWFQVIRALIIGLAIFPFREVFFEKERGWLYLWGLFLGLAIFAPAGAAPGSVEGVVYLTVSAGYHLVYLPEIVVQTLVFSWVLYHWEKRKEDKRLTTLLVILCAAILFIIFLGFLFPEGA